MLGTDYPFPLGELQPGSLIESMDVFDDTLKVALFSSRLLKQHRRKGLSSWWTLPHMDRKESQPLYIM